MVCKYVISRLLVIPTIHLYTASNIPQMLKSSFHLNLLTLHLTTLDEKREEMKLSSSAAGCNYVSIHSFKR